MPISNFRQWVPSLMARNRTLFPRGIIELEEMKMKDAIYNFTQGIPGFETTRKFRLVEQEDVPLAQLISVEDERIGFILMRPGVLFPDYSVDVDAENEEVLNLNVAMNEAGSSSSSALPDGKSKVKVEVWAIVTLNRQDVVQSTLNLRAPILLNSDHKLGVQLILADDRYLARQPMVLDKPLVQEQEGVVG